MVIGGISLPLVITVVVLIVLLLFAVFVLRQRKKQSNPVSPQKGVLDLQEDSDEVIASEIGWLENVSLKRGPSFWKMWRFWFWCMIMPTPTVLLCVLAIIESGKPHYGMEGLGVAIIWLFSGLFVLIGFIGGFAYTLFVRRRESVLGIWAGWGIGLVTFIVVGELG